METTIINNAEFEIHTDDGLYIEFNSDEANIPINHLSANGCRKRVRFKGLELNDKWQIKTNATVHDLSPTGEELNSFKVAPYLTSENDVELFKAQGETLMNSAIINGLARYVMKNTRAFFGLDGNKIPDEYQPIPIPTIEEEAEELNKSQ